MRNVPEGATVGNYSDSFLKKNSGPALAAPSSRVSTEQLRSVKRTRETACLLAILARPLGFVFSRPDLGFTVNWVLTIGCVDV